MFQESLHNSRFFQKNYWGKNDKQLTKNSEYLDRNIDSGSKRQWGPGWGPLWTRPAKRDETVEGEYHNFTRTVR